MTTMKSLACFREKLNHHPWQYYKSFKSLMMPSFRFIIFHVNPFWIQLAYFLVLSLVGFLALKISNPRTDYSSSSSFKPKNIDIFFTSVSATTVSSMSTVEMEYFSNTQLVIMTILMFIGGEVFTSMLELQLGRFKSHSPSKPAITNSLELVSAAGSVSENQKTETDLENNINNSSLSSQTLMYASSKSLGYVVLGYLTVIHLAGSCLVALYTSMIPSARQVLSKKNLHIQTFSIFTVVSTFANCGFIPTNENMIVFKRNSGLLLILVPLVLSGNTLYAPSLRFLIWVLHKITKREEYSYILKNTREIGYNHLMSRVQSWFLVFTVLGFIVLQLIVFCGMEWSNDQVMGGLSNWFEKLVAAIFQVVSTRHSGESIVDISILSPAILVIFIVMMYFPPCTSFLPLKKEDDVAVSGKGRKSKTRIMQSLLFSQLSYLVIFIILICIVENEKLKKDPLNFNVLNITLEVISAYGNVGYSTGYSCARQIKANSSCKDAWFGLAGRWSNSGKFILIIVMFFGRLKKFNINNGGKAWKIS